jgi:hypothetical protein
MKMGQDNVTQKLSLVVHWEVTVVGVQVLLANHAEQVIPKHPITPNPLTTHRHHTQLTLKLPTTHSHLTIRNQVTIPKLLM